VYKHKYIQLEVEVIDDMLIVLLKLLRQSEVAFEDEIVGWMGYG
jgi:hypothetical protein